MTTRLQIAFQGEPGANSHEACRTHFPQLEPLPCATFEDAFEAIKSGEAALGMIPVENSIAGRVADVHHLLPNSGLKIIGERFKPIRFQLMANRGVALDQVKTVASMPIALGQCRKTIRKLGLKTESAGDTAGAAKALSEHPDPTRAAIAPALAAELYGLDILLKDIEDEHHNTTRFLVMTAERDPPRPPAGVLCVTSFVFRVRNLPAALYKALGGFATNGVNMTKLESYMENGAFTATFFYAEVDGRPEDLPVSRAFEELGFFSERFEILGVYPADPFRETAGT
ncbi:prephenate dehydratase [Phenylobacterium montanum]|uniref:prephenate dehydratase n=1 Tax=Phenylobacterium montanum TaxID=2823693 RepID=A0A975FY80_9CAUL|nr:prephenate dehydratase [Caulobacter sp. S6]QUD87038.1 prephenate dehydratase [Caulobacter sp. S6]